MSNREPAKVLMTVRRTFRGTAVLPSGGQAGSVRAEGHLTSVGWRWREVLGQGDWAARSPERWLGESLISRTVSVEASPPFGIAQKVRAQERPLFSAVR